jgi:hypothetical protein
MDATLALPLLYGLIAVALLFDFLNGLLAAQSVGLGAAAFQRFGPMRCCSVAVR